jgi:hypothetical protein
MPLNLTTAKTFRQYAAIEGVNHPPVHPSFKHARPNNDALSPSGLLVDNVLVPPTFTADAATDLLTTTSHGLVADTPVRFATTNTLPGGLSLATTYYVIASGLTSDDFKISATLGGGTVDITSPGTGVHSWSRYLTTEEQEQVTRWQRHKLDDNVTLPAALLWVQAQIAYEASPQHQAFIIDDYLQRVHQWIWRSADHADAAQAATPPSADDTGAVTTPPPASPANRSPN